MSRAVIKNYLTKKDFIINYITVSLPVQAIKLRRGINAYLVIYCLILVVSVFLISINGFDMETSFSAVVACFNNVGPGLSAVGPTGNYADFSIFSKLVLCIDMLAGRLEIFPILILFNPATYKK